MGGGGAPGRGLAQPSSCRYFSSGVMGTRSGPLRTMRRSVAFQWFLTALHVRPGSTCARPRA